MKNKKKRKKNNQKPGVNISIEEIHSRVLFQGLYNIFNLVSILKTKAEEIRKKGKLRRLGKGIKGIYGFCINTTGLPVVETFGNIKRTDKETIIEEEREPLVDVFNNASQILIMAELPGVEQNDIRLEVKDKILIISAKGKERQYKKEILLPDSVEKFVPLQTFKNGILELKFLKPHR